MERVEIKIIGSKIYLRDHTGCTVMVDFSDVKNDCKPAAVILSGIRIAVKPYLIKPDSDGKLPEGDKLE